MRGRMMAFVVVMASLLGGCGGGDDDKQARDARPSAGQQRDPGGAADGDAKQVRAVVREALTTKDPDACTRLLTRSAVEQFTYQRGSKAISECREDADEVGARSVKIGRVEVDGDRAQAQVEPRGGTLTLKEATFALLEEGDRWKIDRLTAGTLDRPAFFREARKQLREEADDLGAEGVGCVTDALKRRKDAEIMKLYLDGDARVLIVPTMVCAIRSQIPRTQATAAYTECVTRAATRELTTGALGRELAGDADLNILDSERFAAAFEDIVADCVRLVRPGSSARGVS
jgi:hypothetical protein